MLKRFIYLGVSASLVLGGLAARAQDAGALLDLLVRKKIITDQEAEEVRAELTKEVATTSAGKWKLSTPITELELYGDARLRYEYRGGETGGVEPLAAPSPGVAGRHDWQERERERYRLRIGLRGTLADDWFFGVRLETSTNPRSTNVTFGDDSNNGPFAKNSDGINVGQVYLGYRGFPDITLTGGKMPNPLITTLMVWDADINPEGLSEQWKHSFTFNIGGDGAGALRLFEAGAVYLPQDGEPLPREPYCLGGLLAGPARTPTWRDPEPPAADFYAVKGVVAALLERRSPIARRVKWLRLRRLRSLGS